MTPHESPFTRRSVLRGVAGAAAFTATTAFITGLPGGAFAAETAETSGAEACATDPNAAKRQFRAIWIAGVVNIDWPSRQGLDPAAMKAEYLAWLDLATRLNLNAVVVHVRPTADAFWPSPHEPWSEWLTGTQGQDPGFDPLGFAVAEAHKRNLEFHAWFNPYRVSMPADTGSAGPDPSKLAAGHPAREQPEWVQAYPIDAAGSRLYYDPGVPEVRAFVQTAMMDAVTRYDIDGVHWDDYFYPYPAAGQDFADDDTFARYGAGWSSKADWRRNNVNLLVKEMGERIKAAKPWVKFGISPFGIWRNKATDPLGSDTNGFQSYDQIYADTRKWVKEQWIDYIVPQVYWNIGFTVADYAKLVPWWNDVVSGTKVHLYVGQAVYKVGTTGAWLDPAEMSKHLTFNQGYAGALGDIHFSAKDVRADRLGSTTKMAADHYGSPALPPEMPQLGGKAPVSPEVEGVRRTSEGVTLTWRRPPTPPRSGDAVSYAVYRFDGRQDAERCDFADARHLVATLRGTGDQISFTDTTAEAGKGYTYYVTALDRVATESRPSDGTYVR